MYGDTMSGPDASSKLPESSAAAPEVMKPGVRDSETPTNQLCAPVGFVWKLQCRGSYAELCEKLGQELFADTVKARAVQDLIKDIPEQMLTAPGKDLFKNIMSELDRFLQLLTPEQEQLREVCAQANFSLDRTSRPAWANGAHIFVSAALANEISDAFDKGELRKGHIVVSDELRPLVDKVMGAQSKQKPSALKLCGETQSPLAALSPIDAQITRLNLFQSEDGNPYLDMTLKKVCVTPSLATRLTHSTGSRPRHADARNKSYGTLRKHFKLRKLPVHSSEATSASAENDISGSQQERNEGDKDSEGDGPGDTYDWVAFSGALSRLSGVPISAADVETISKKCTHCMFEGSAKEELSIADDQSNFVTAMESQADIDDTAHMGNLDVGICPTAIDVDVFLSTQLVQQPLLCKATAFAECVQKRVDLLPNMLQIFLEEKIPLEELLANAPCFSIDSHETLQLRRQGWTLGSGLSVLQKVAKVFYSTDALERLMQPVSDDTMVVVHKIVCELHSSIDTAFKKEASQTHRDLHKLSGRPDGVHATAKLLKVVTVRGFKRALAEARATEVAEMYSTDGWTEVGKSRPGSKVSFAEGLETTNDGCAGRQQRAGAASPPSSQKEIEVPKKAKGMLLGPDGKHLRDMRSWPGVNSIVLAGELLTVKGTSKGVDSVVMKVQSVVNRVLALGKKIKGEQLHFNLVTSSLVKFVPSDCSNLMVDPRVMDADRQHFVLCPLPSSSNLQSSLQLERSCKKRNVVTVPISHGRMCIEFLNFLEHMTAMPPFAQLSLGIQFGITFFHSLENDIAKGELSLQDLLNLEPHTHYKPIFAYELSTKADHLTSMILSLGFEPSREQLSTCAVVYPKDRSVGCLVVDFEETLETAEQVPHKSTSVLQGLPSQCLKPDWLQKKTPPQLPKIQRVPKMHMKKFVDKYVRAHVIKPEGQLGFHSYIKASETYENIDIRQSLEDAWKQGTLAVGDLDGDAGVLNIETIRRSRTHAFSDGLFEISVEEVSESALRHAAKRTTYMLVKMKCLELDKLMATKRAEMDANDRGRCSEDSDFGQAVNLFSKLVREAEQVAAKLSQ